MRLNKKTEVKRKWKKGKTQLFQSSFDWVSVKNEFGEEETEKEVKHTKQRGQTIEQCNQTMQEEKRQVKAQ